MSRSRRKTPILGICGAGSQAWFRSMSWGRERAEVRDILQKVLSIPANQCDPALGYNNDVADDAHVIMPHPWRYGDEWESPRDGKMWFGEDKWAEHEDCNDWWGFCPKCGYDKAMRK